MAIVGPTFISPTEILRLGSVLDSQDPSVAYLWSTVGTNVTSHPNVSTYLRTELDGPSFVLSPGLLEPGVTYVFQLEVTDRKSELTGFATSAVTVLSNLVITNFTVDVVPQDSTNTSKRHDLGYTFRLEAVAYSPEAHDDQVLYRFGYFFTNANSELEYVLTTASPLQSATGMLRRLEMLSVVCRFV